MPKLSSYSNFDYPDGQEEIMPWEFWTEEERSLVIREGYRGLVLTSPEVKPYLNTSRIHFWTQWLVPIAAAATIFGPLKSTLLASSWRQHYMTGYKRKEIVMQIVGTCWEVSPFFG